MVLPRPLPKAASAMTDLHSNNAAPHETPHAARSSQALFLLLLLWLLTTAAYKGAVNVGTGITGIDFTIFYHAAQRLAAGMPLYQPHGELGACFSLRGSSSAPCARGLMLLGKIGAKPRPDSSRGGPAQSTSRAVWRNALKTYLACFR